MAKPYYLSNLEFFGDFPKPELAKTGSQASIRARVRKDQTLEPKLGEFRSTRIKDSFQHVVLYTWT